MWKYLELKVPIKYTKNNSCYKIDMLWYNFARRSKTIVEHLKYIYIYILNLKLGQDKLAIKIKRIEKSYNTGPLLATRTG